MKTYLLPLLSLLIFLTSCQQNKDLDGHWYGRYKTEGYSFPVLVYFQGNEFYDYFMNDVYDTCTFTCKKDWFFFTPKNFGEKLDLHIEKKGNELFFFDPEADTVMFRLQKSQGLNYIHDYILDSSILFQLPDVGGNKGEVGNQNRFRNIIYLGYKNDQIVVNFRDSTLIFDDSFYIYLNNAILEMDRHDFLHSTIYIAADKKLPVSVIKNLKKQLRLIGFHEIQYILKPNHYAELNYFKAIIRPLSEEEFKEFDTSMIQKRDRLPSPFILNLDIMEGVDRIQFINRENKAIKINNIEIASDSLVDVMIAIMERDRKTMFSYYIPDTVKYEEYIDFFIYLRNTATKIREKYYLKEYEKPIDENFKYTEEYQEFIRKYPIYLWELDSGRYNEVKEILEIH